MQPFNPQQPGPQPQPGFPQGGHPVPGQYQNYPPRPQSPPENTMANYALAVSIASIFTCGLVSPGALYLAVRARRELVASEVKPKNAWMVPASFVISGIMCIGLVVAIGVRMRYFGTVLGGVALAGCVAALIKKPPLPSRYRKGSMVGAAVAVLVMLSGAKGASNVVRMRAEREQQASQVKAAEDAKAKADAVAARVAAEHVARAKVERDALLATVAANGSPADTASACTKLAAIGGVPQERKGVCSNAVMLPALTDLSHAQQEDKIAELAETLRELVSPTGSLSDQVRTMLHPLDEFAASVAELPSKLEAAQADSKPEDKPSFKKPDYTGARPIYGTLKSKYAGGLFGTDGIVITSGSKYYVVEGAEASIFADSVHGYAKPTGKTVTLDLGNGREADVLKISDAESYADDQKSYKQEVAEATKAFHEEQKKWSDAAMEAVRLKKQIADASRKKTDALRALPPAAQRLLATLHQQ